MLQALVRIARRQLIEIFAVSFLEDPKNINWIRWSEDGNSFIVLDEDEFARKLIPELFKHNNYASFVRQLNMYGFHKKVGLSDNSMRASERKNKSPSEYANPYFKRGHPDLLWLIQKPKNVTGQGSKGTGKGSKTKIEDGEDNEVDEFGDAGAAHNEDRARNRGQLALTATSKEVLPKEQLAGVYRELQNIRAQQHVISTTIHKLRMEHEQLYAQAANFQEQHTRHENSINAILTFLATVYNRSLQGHDGQQNLTNPFSGIIPKDHQGSVVDYEDYTLNNLNAELANQRGFKKQPLLLKAPPKQTDAHGRASTMSPSTTSTYDRSAQSRKPSSQHSQPNQPRSGTIEEVHDSGSPPQTTSQHNQSQQFPQRDIMSVIQNSIARNGNPMTSLDFPHVLSSLETSGGNSALTPDQRAHMLRLITHDANAADPNTTASPNNALITPTPPPMPHNYSDRLANTRDDLNNLAKLQAQQDRSVQNLTNILGSFSPTGSIPGIGDDVNVPPPPFELDQLFDPEMFADMPDLDRSGFDFGTDGTSGPQNDSLQATADAGGLDHSNFGLDGTQDDEPLFDDPTSVTASGNRANQPSGAGYTDGYDDLFGTGGAGVTNNNSKPPRGGVSSSPRIKQEPERVVESFTDSESTSPANTVEVDDTLPNINNNDTIGISPKRRRRN